MGLQGKGQTCGGSQLAIPVEVFRGLRGERSHSRPVSKFRNYLEGPLESIFGWVEIFSYLQWQKASPGVWKHPLSCQKNDGCSLQLGWKLTHGRQQQELGAAQPLCPLFWAGLPWGRLRTEDILPQEGHQTGLWSLHHLGLERSAEEEGSRGKVLPFPEVHCCLLYLLEMPRFSTRKVGLERSSLGPHHLISPGLEELILPSGWLVTGKTGRCLGKDKGLGLQEAPIGGR